MSDVHISSDCTISDKDCSSEDETNYTDVFMKHQSIFEQQNLILKVKGRKIHVNKEQLMKESPVFEAMLSGEFKEKYAKEVKLPGKHVDAVVHFLRCTLPGIDEKLTDSRVRKVLPLADEYQASRTLTKVDNYLAKQCRQKTDGISSEEIISSILEAEKYQLKKYLDECITVASRKYYQNILLNEKYKDISQETKLKICEKRWKDIDNLCVSQSYYGHTFNFPTEKLKQFMNTD